MLPFADILITLKECFTYRRIMFTGLAHVVCALDEICVSFINQVEILIMSAVEVLDLDKHFANSVCNRYNRLSGKI